jgi:spermidine synthase
MAPAGTSEEGETERWPRLALLLLVTTGGLAALSWEVLWQLQTSLALGASALGTAITLATTMAGITVGALAAGRFLRHRKLANPVRSYGILELVIGLSGLLMLPGFRLLETLDTSLYAHLPELAPALRAVGIALLLGPPTFCMGATIPVFELIARDRGSSVSVLYGLNTAGAALGVLLFSFVLLPWLGVRETVLVVSANNLAIWLATRVFGPGRVGPRAAWEQRHSASAAAPGLALASLVVFGTGFATFGLEVAWFRSFRAAFQSTTDSFAIVLASVLAPLAIGARLVPWLRGRGIGPQFTLIAAGAAILLTTPIIERMDLLAPGSTDQYGLILARWLALSLATLGPAMLCLGTALPWYLDAYPQPERAGRLYGLNTLGAVAGSLSAAWLLLPLLGFARSAWLIGGLVLALAFLLGERRSRIAGVLAGAASLAVAVSQTSSLGRERIQGLGVPPGARILAFDEGPDSTVSVVQSAEGPRALFIDGFGASSEHRVGGHYMQWMGHLPMLLHEDPKRALVICFGTGQTANAVREEGVDSLDVVDINQAVFDMAHHFPSNRGVLEDPHVSSIAMDGRAWIRRSETLYDVITLEPLPPHFAGMNNLYSREFYALMADHLTPDGVATQWLPLHLLPPIHAASVVATFLDVFPDSLLWIDPIGGTGILLGRTGPTDGPLGNSWPGLVRNSGPRPLTPEQVKRAALLGSAALATYARDGVVITDDNQQLAYGLLRSSSLFYYPKKLGRLNLAKLARIAGRRVSR